MNEKHSVYLHVGCNCAMFGCLHGVRLTLQKLIFGSRNAIIFKMRGCSWWWLRVWTPKLNRHDSCSGSFTSNWKQFALNIDQKKKYNSVLK